MTPINFFEWLARRIGMDHLPAADQVVPVVAAAGPAGLSRRALGNFVKLDRPALDELLAGLVAAGLLTRSVDEDGPLYTVGAVGRVLGP